MLRDFKPSTWLLLGVMLLMIILPGFFLGELAQPVPPPPEIDQSNPKGYKAPPAVTEEQGKPANTPKANTPANDE